MKVIHAYKLSLRIRWIFASILIREGLLFLLGWSEIERYLTKETHTFIFKHKVQFKIKNN